MEEKVPAAFPLGIVREPTWLRWRETAQRQQRPKAKLSGEISEPSLE